MAEAIARLDIRSIALLINRGVSMAVPLDRIPPDGFLSGLSKSDRLIMCSHGGGHSLTDVVSIVGGDETLLAGTDPLSSTLLDIKQLSFIGL